MSRCLSPHLALGKADHPVTTIHLHSDGKWWFWQNDGLIEHGPFASQSLAEDACQLFSARIEKPAVRFTALPSVFSKHDLLIGLLIVLIYWFIFYRR